MTAPKNPQVLDPDQVGERINLNDALTANDDSELSPDAAIGSAYGGRVGVAIMLLVAVFVGVLLATGGVL